MSDNNSNAVFLLNLFNLAFGMINIFLIPEILIF